MAATKPGRVRVVVEDKAFRRMMLRLQKRTSDLRPFFQDVIDPSVSEFFTKQFATRGAHGRQMWAPNTPLTQKLKSRPGHGRGGTGAVGQDTRELWASLVKSPAPRGIRVIRRDRYERGTLVPYARIFHEGQTARTIFGNPRRSPARIAARPLIPDPVPGFLIRDWGRGLTRYLERSR